MERDWFTRFISFNAYKLDQSFVYTYANGLTLFRLPFKGKYKYKVCACFFETLINYIVRKPTSEFPEN
jgi:hypothetical protein